MKFDTLWVAIVTGVAIAAGLVALGYVVIQAFYPAPDYQDPLARKKESCLFCSGPELREHRTFGHDPIDQLRPGNQDEPALISERGLRIQLAGRVAAIS